MKEVPLPKSFLDFADALRMLAKSSLDATEIVTKWYALMDTTTPDVVTITVNGVTREVDNLAKMRKDFESGLSVDNPVVKGIRFVAPQTQGSTGATGSHGLYWNTAGENPYVDDIGWVGIFRDVYNDFRSVCMPDKEEVHLEFLKLAQVILLGTVRTPGVTPQDTLKLYVAAPSSSYVQSRTMAAAQYYTMTTLVNRNAGSILPDGSPEHAEGLPFTVQIYDSLGTLLYSKVLNPWKAVKLLMFTAPGQNTVNVQEIVYDI